MASSTDAKSRGHIPPINLGAPHSTASSSKKSKLAEEVNTTMEENKTNGIYDDVMDLYNLGFEAGRKKGLMEGLNILTKMIKLNSELKGVKIIEGFSNIIINEIKKK